MKIFVAIPVYDGKLHVQLIRCLLNEQAVALANGDDFQVSFLSSNAGITQGRNQLAHEFMQTDFDRLVFLDSDVTFEPGALVNLAHKPVDFVGGCYRYKKQDECYPIGWLQDRSELWADANGLLEVASLPTGFLALSRKVFEEFQTKFPDREVEHFGQKSFCYFQMPILNGVLYGEDSWFCVEWRNLGGKIYVDPEITLTHWDMNNPIPHVGHIGNWLKSRGLKSAETKA